jgi:4-hydroxythreonine-4-phosphate dehydrogenase
MRGWLGITLGDPSGIGPEVTLKALSRLDSQDSTQYLVLGDSKLVLRLNESLRLNLPLIEFQDYSQIGRFFYANVGPELPEVAIGGSAVAAKAAMAALTDGAQRCLKGELDGIVTAPVNKESIIRLGQPFMGQTEYLSDLADTARTAMMLLGADDRGRWLRVALVTTHLPIRKVADNITTEKVLQTIELAAKSCHDLGLTRARIGVCGLNPHAGEGGEIGTEELSTIIPAAEHAKTLGIDVVGPLAADTLFYYAYHGHYDAVVAMYHDQGLAPLKMIGFESGINWTLGLPFVRTSPDHGTAYDIAGQNKANPQSMLAAIKLARRLSSKPVTPGSIESRG